jgi:prefoldin subunit 5
MTSDSTTRWPLLEERAPFATAARSRRGRRAPRSAWLLTGLAFLCGGLVSAAVFSIGWRHQAQRDSAAQTALAAAHARAQRLEQRIGALQASLGRANAAATAAKASEQALVKNAATVAQEATASSSDGAAISSGAVSLTTAAGRIAGELNTLDTYLTTTPSGQLDPGYIASQTAYLARQLTRLQGDAGTLGNSVASFEAALRKLSRGANGLKTR